jgi:exodeoxyribonuclease V alpha subunit
MSRGAAGFGPFGRALSALLTRIEGTGRGYLEGFAPGSLDEILGGTLALSAALVAEAIQRGDTCVDTRDAGGRTLADVLGDLCPPGREDECLPKGPVWRSRLRRSGVVGPSGGYAPLILDASGRLYLHRYWSYEQMVARDIRARAQMPAEVDPDRLRASIERLFPDSVDTDWQRLAAGVAVLRHFAVVSGGPGTGKTYTLVRILALIAEQELAAGRHPRIVLAAPTGKAASRLAESVRVARAGLACSADALALIPGEATTLHRMLVGYRPGGGPRRVLPIDLLVVDESSMADVSLVASVLGALRPEARLVLAGDRDQLSSVEAGVVLGDICDTGREHGYRPATAALLEDATGTRVPAGLQKPNEPPLAACLAVLRRNYRMPEDSALAALSRSINRGEADAVLNHLRRGDDAASIRPWGTSGDLEAALRGAVVPWFRACLAARTPEELFSAFAAHVVLCGVRKGPAGVESLDTLIREMLRRTGLAGHGLGREGMWFPCAPILVTVNDYAVRLFNGDIGIVPPPRIEMEGRAAPDAPGHACLFARPEGGHRLVSTARLPAHEGAFSLTVHKSQGSEFERVTLILPPDPAPVLTRELLYTAVTRARAGLTIFGDEEVVRWMVEHPTRRRSGLRDLLWAP